MIQNFTDINTQVSTYFSHLSTLIIDPIMGILDLIIILTTIFSNNLDDIKWFIGHTAFFNIIVVIFRVYEDYFVIFFDDFQFRYLIYSSACMVSMNSMFPLALSRFGYLYFNNFYNKIFKKMYLFTFLIVFDMIMIFLYLWINMKLVSNFWSSFLVILTDVIVLLGTLICSYFILAKLKSLMILSQNTTDLAIYANIKKAMYICIFQAASSAVLVLSLAYINAYLTFYGSDPSYLAYMFFITVVALHPGLFSTLAILESIIILVVLKSYRESIKYGVLKMFKKIGGKPNQATISSPTIKVIIARN